MSESTNKIIYRSISNLPMIDEGSLAENALFQVSQMTAGGIYHSYRATFGNVMNSIVSASVNRAAREFGIPDGLDVLSDLAEPVSSLISGDMDFSGKKNFLETPTVLSSEVATVKDIQNAMAATEFVFNPGSKTSANPDNSSGQTRDDGNLMMWNIDSGQRDSSRFIDPDTGEVAGYKECRQNGNLVIYGWLADNGNVNPEECWVGLFQEIENGDGTVRPTLIQMQPWIIGQNSQIAQYVGFNVPVRKGTKLKIMTGFNVNGQNSGFGESNSLMISRAGSMINTFVGYIVNNGEQ